MLTPQRCLPTWERKLGVLNGRAKEGRAQPTPLLNGAKNFGLTRLACGQARLAHELNYYYYYIY